MVENKTKATDTNVASCFDTISEGARREDCEALADLMAKATKHPPQMWGSSIVGFGRYHYKYESGREGDSCLVGFSSRKDALSLYGLNAAPSHGNLLPQLGKHKAGKGCLYIRSLSDIDLSVLEKLVAAAAAAEKPQPC